MCIQSEMPLLLLAALGFILYKSASELTDKLSFEPTGFNLSQQILSLKIKNPTETSATIRNVYGSIYANKIRIGSYTVGKPFIIPAFSSAIIDIKIDLDKIEVFNQIVSVLQSGQTPAISISGNIGTSLGKIAFENSIVEKTNLLKNAA